MNLDYPLTPTDSYDLGIVTSYDTTNTSVYSSAFVPNLCINAFSKTMTDSNLSSGTGWQSASPTDKTTTKTFTDFTSVQIPENNLQKNNNQHPSIVAFKTKNFLTINPGNVEEFETRIKGKQLTSGFGISNVTDSIMHITTNNNHLIATSQSSHTIPNEKYSTSDTSKLDVTSNILDYTDDLDIYLSKLETQNHSIPSDLDYSIPFLLPPGVVGPSMLLFEENPILKASLSSKDPMVKYLSNALIKIIDQSFENDNNWVIRRLEWIETINSIKKALAKHENDKISLTQQIKTLIFAYEIIKKQFEKLNHQNLTTQNELIEAQKKINLLKQEKLQTVEQKKWDIITTAIIVGVGIVSIEIVLKKLYKS
ncbi:25489_t:CDS:2 [Gigaspora margarita]|uniref:25489_t:CDS:1 n=1 Tax=Gigaspora margarita TaxID=4874 RepID=A0ABN7UMG3_GIGMA|nr:25489_t:CDS:2 [Gigaspora margarita]